MQENTPKNNDVFSAMENTLIENCPGGFGVNPKALKGIAKGLVRTGGICPCTHDEWDENTPREDKLCPCKTFCETGDCHCNLYIRL
jgi:ferredoxin-thioredoxin reductase catalytic subunit